MIGLEMSKSSLFYYQIDNGILKYSSLCLGYREEFSCLSISVKMVREWDN